MVNEKRIIKKGELFILTEGEYSNYQIIMACCALADLDTTELLNEFTGRASQRCVLLINPYEYWERPENLSFPNWLVNIKKVAEELPPIEWHFEGYKEMYADLRRTFEEEE